MKKLMFVAVLALALGSFGAKGIYAEETCTTVYGGGVVCGASYPEHKPVKTDLADINPAILGGAFSLISGVFYKVSRKLKKSSDALY